MLKLVCRDEPEAILSAIYEAWADSCPNSEIEIILEGACQQVLFCEYRCAKESRIWAERVADSILQKLSLTVWEWVRSALMADEPDKAQAIFQFLRYAFRVGSSAVKQYARPEVMRVFELQRMVNRERHLLLGFTRFADTKAGVLVALITPKHRQAALLAAHFANRFPNERFLICDQKRGEAVVYVPDIGWYLTQWSNDARLREMISEAEQDTYGELWNCFFQSVTIEERHNIRCQNNLLPLRFRPNMTEFRSGSLCSKL